MKIETIAKGNKLVDEIDKLKEHIGLVNKSVDRSATDKVSLRFEIKDGNGHYDRITLSSMFFSKEEFIALYLMCANVALAKKQAELEALKDE